MIPITLKLLDSGELKDFLNSVIDEHKKISGPKTHLATMMKCHRTTLSQYFSGKASLQIEHIVNLANALGLDGMEKQFLINLSLMENMASTENKIFFKSANDRIKKSVKHKAQTVVSGIESQKLNYEYFSFWPISYIHFTLMSSPLAETQIVEKTKLSTEVVASSLSKLENMGLVKCIESFWQLSTRGVALEIGDPLESNHHQLLRQKANEYLKNDLITNTRGKNNSLHFTSMLSLDENMYKKLLLSLKDLLGQMRFDIADAGDDIIANFCIDLHKL